MNPAQTQIRTMTFFNEYFEQIYGKLHAVDVEMLDRLAVIFKDAHGCGHKIILAGNGGSGSTASHVAIDLTKAAGVRAVTFNDDNLLTCFANDYGYEHWLERALEFYSESGDVAVLISSSGRSPNIVNGAAAAQARGLRVVTLSGFDSDNPLRSLGELNFWVDSRSYNVVEMTHHIWLVAAVDKIVKDKGDVE
jgi:D-sedoheptulose 7-phosphate isomerase